MKALGFVVSDKKIFESFILKTYFLTPWPTYATNWNGLNNFDRGPSRDHSCEVWSKSNKRFQRRCRLKKLLTHARTDGRRTLKDHKSTSCSGELKNSLNISFSYYKWLKGWNSNKFNLHQTYWYGWQLTYRQKWRSMLRQRWENVLRQALHVHVANDIQKFQSSDWPKWGML